MALDRCGSSHRPCDTGGAARPGPCMRPCDPVPCDLRGSTPARLTVRTLGCRPTYAQGNGRAFVDAARA